jgi:hypothetical protein
MLPRLRGGIDSACHLEGESCNNVTIKSRYGAAALSPGSLDFAEIPQPR